MPVWEVIKTQPREILTSAFVRMSEQAPFYLFITFVLTYGTKQLGLPRGDLLNYTLVAAAIGLISVPLFGHLSDLYRPAAGLRRSASSATALFAFPYYGLLNTKDRAAWCCWRSWCR